MKLSLAQLCTIFLWGLLGFIWVLHALGIFVPETGFDAVWYHLPIIKAISEQGHPVYLPNLYQSLNPTLGELFFVSGWKLAGETGAKFIAYLFALSCVGLGGLMARRWLTGTWWLVTVILFSLVQVVSWQASSVYVDVMKATWELLALELMLRTSDSSISRGIWASGLCLGASLATKLFSLLLIPFWSGWLLVQKTSWKEKVIGLVFLLAVPAPFYWWAYVHTGNPFYALTLHTEKITEISGQTSLANHLIHQTVWIWFSPIQLLLSRDYINWLVTISLPLVVIDFFQKPRDSQKIILGIFALYQWLIWWFVPPLSTRYALSGFIALMLLTLISLQRLSKRSQIWKQAIVLTIVLSIGFHLIPRMLVARRQLKYLTGSQTKEQYLEQFMDGNIDQHLREWHQLPK